MAKDRCYEQHDLDKIHKVLHDELKELQRICDKHDIPMFLIGGTAIGAVRHKGFIPWDDDIDVGLLRKDYDRLLEILPEELDEKFGFDNWDTNKDFPAPNTCIYAKGTLAVPMEMKDCKYKYGISMGVYPYDNVSDNEAERKKQFRRGFFWGRIHWLKVLPFPYIPYKGFKRAAIYTVCAVAHVCLKLVPKKWIVARCENVIRSCNDKDTKYCTIVLDSAPTGNMLENADIFPLCNADFEGTTTKLIAGYDKALRNLYGDYMQLPPEDSRKNHFPHTLDYGDYEF